MQEAASVMMLCPPNTRFYRSAMHPPTVSTDPVSANRALSYVALRAKQHPLGRSSILPRIGRRFSEPPSFKSPPKFQDDRLFARVSLVFAMRGGYNLVGC